MIEELLPPGAHAAETFGDNPDAYLLPAEEPIVARAVEKRRREVTNARTCARTALRELTGAEFAIPRGEKGEPRWPAGVVGAITHTKGYCAAVVASAEKLRGVGIDAEEHGPLPDGVFAHIAFGAERDQLAELGAATGQAGRDGIHWDRLLFSAKESVYKVWFPLTRRWLGFEDAELTLDPAGGGFRARILIDGTTVDNSPELTELSGKFLVRNGIVVTAIALSH